MAEEVKLLGAWGIPFSRRIEMALALKGIPFEYIEENVHGSGIDDKFKSPLLQKYNPIHNKVPVLLHNGKPVLESLIILEYIDETWKHNPILPEDPREKALARFWAKFIDDNCRKFFWAPEKSERRPWKKKESLKTVESVLNRKKFFAGDENIKLLDIAASFIAFWLRVIQEVSGLEFLAAEKHPGLIRWSEEFVSCNAVKEHLPPKHKVVTFLNNMLSGSGNCTTD